MDEQSSFMSHREGARRLTARALAFAVVCCAAAPAFGASLRVRVAGAEDGEVLPGATVTLAEIGRESVTGADGVAEFKDVPPGAYHVQTRLPGFVAARSEVTLGEGQATVEVGLSAQIHFSESVTVGPGSRDTFESYQPTTVLAADDLQSRLASTLGDTLGQQLGVNTRSFGPGPSRPVVRGFDGDRVLVLENGARTGDLSSQSADHGVTLDPAAATQVEVVRGPATLLYGSNALGGVVNLVSDEIPRQPVEGVHGAAVVQGGTANDQAGGAGNVVVGNGRWAFRANLTGQRTGLVDTPAGAIGNSDSRNASGGGGVAYTGTDGFAGASYQYVDTEYGVPVIEDGNISLNPRRHRLDVRGERRNMGGLISGMKFQGGYRDYRHEEIDAGEIGTRFRNRFAEGQLLLNHAPAGRLTGSFGLWGSTRDYESEGEEALAPPTTQQTLAAFLYEELRVSNHFTLQLGARFDHTRFTPEASAVPEREDVDRLRDRRFDELSGSVGLLAFLRDDLTLAANFARAARNPSLEELFNNGPHPGNFAFEIGNPALDSEVGTGFDVSLRYRARRVALEATYFRNSIDGYIFGFPTGQVEDDLAVVRFDAADSLFQGVEAHADLGLSDSVWLELGADAVRARLRRGGGDLPRIPPARVWAGVRYEKNGFHVEAEVRGALEQDRTFGVETSTDGYALLNAHASYTFASGNTAHIVTLRVDNAFDRLYRNHLSYVKELVPEMGRAFRLVYSVRF